MSLNDRIVEFLSGEGDKYAGLKDQYLNIQNLYETKYVSKHDSRVDVYGNIWSTRIYLSQPTST